MPKRARELQSIQVRRLAERPGFHAVGGVPGLHLQVSPNLATSWILRIKIANKRTDLGLGSFPSVTLSAARDNAREAREFIRQGIDPRQAKKEALEALKASQAKEITFEQAATRCHLTKVSSFGNEKHKKDWISSLRTHALPLIGNIRVADIEMAHVVAVLEPIWIERTETASRVRQRIESVLAWATVNKFRAGENPARWKGNLEHALPAPAKVRKVTHMKALPWRDIGAFMADLRGRDGMSARALEFAILTAARSGEVRFATWNEIDVEGKLWSIPGDRMKSGRSHRVPLSAPVIQLLNTLPRAEDSDYIFPAKRGGPLSDMSISAVCRRMEVDAVPHGFRSSFKDWCRSSTSYPDEVSELALAHVNNDATRAAYARDELLPKRAKLMGAWGRYCATVPKKASVTPIRKSR